MSRLYNILNALIKRNGTVVSVTATPTVTMNSTPTLCTATIPADGTWLILSNVFLPLGSAMTNIVYQNRLTVGEKTSYVNDGQTRGRTLSLLNWMCGEFSSGTTVSLATYSTSTGSTAITGEINLIKVA